MKQTLHNRAIGYFDAVRRHGSIREAARRLGIAASAINRHILKLEADIGMPLFDRLADGMALTPAGEVLARHAIAVLQDERRAIGELEGLMGLRRGELSLVAVESLGTGFLPDLIERMSRKYPGVQIKAGLAGSNAIPGMLARGEADVGLAFSLPAAADLQQMAVGRFTVSAVMKPDHPLAGRDKVSVADCLAHPLILPRPDLSLFTLLDPLLRRHHGRASVIAEVSSLVLMKNLTLRTGAISFQTRLGIESELQSGQLAAVPLYAAGPVTTELGAYVREGRALPMAVNAFLTLVGEALSPPPIRIAAALILNEAGRTLVVRKRGTRVFMQAGGKIEPGESPEAALRRELREEIGIELAEEPQHLGRFSAPAAHEEGRVVEAEIFLLRVSGEVTPAAELEEIRWIDPAAPGSLPLARLTGEQVLPLAQRFVK